MGEQDDLENLDRILDTLEASNPDLAHRVALFITQNLLNEPNPDSSSYRIAYQYAAWALTHAKIAMRDEITYRCTCFHGMGWIFDEDGAVYPCDKCQGVRVLRWTEEFVDSNEGPT